MSQGLYNVLLGTVVDIDPAVFEARELYLEVEVNGEVMDADGTTAMSGF